MHVLVCRVLHEASHTLNNARQTKAKECKWSDKWDQGCHLNFAPSPHWPGSMSWSSKHPLYANMAVSVWWFWHESFSSKVDARFYSLGARKQTPTHTTIHDGISIKPSSTCGCCNLDRITMPANSRLSWKFWDSPGSVAQHDLITDRQRKRGLLKWRCKVCPKRTGICKPNLSPNLK